MEQWKDIEGYEGLYQVSNLGRVMALNFKKTGKERLLSIINRNSYGALSCSKNGVKKQFLVSRLVAIHFIPNPDNLPLVCHKIEDLDENGMLYNGEDNLWWGTMLDNNKDRHKKGRTKTPFILNNPNQGKFGKENHSSIPVEQYSIYNNFIKRWDSASVVQRELGLSQSSITRCCKGRTITAGGFVWKYL